MKIHDDSSDLVIDDEGQATKAEPARPGPIIRIAYAIGSIGLLVATAADAVAVAGRHTGFHLLGSIEVIQASVVLIASMAMIAATVVGAHASVHILTERLARPAALRLARISDVFGALFFLLVAAGSIWVAADLWTGFEQTELLAIPLRWFRVVWIASALLIAILFLRNAWRRRHGA